MSLCPFAKLHLTSQAFHKGKNILLNKEEIWRNFKQLFQVSFLCNKCYWLYGLKSQKNGRIRAFEFLQNPTLEDLFYLTDASTPLLGACLVSYVGLQWRIQLHLLDEPSSQDSF